MRAGFLVLFAIVACAKAPPAATPSRLPLSVKEIIQKVNARYATAKTYRDEGTVEVRFSPGEPGAFSEKAHIRAIWIAPDRIRFDFDREAGKFDDADEIVVWNSGGIVREYFLGKVEEHATLSNALHAVQGVSEGTSGLAPRWLLERSSRLGERITYRLAGEVACSRARCFRLEGTKGDRTVLLDIDTTTFALRRYWSRNTIVPSESEIREHIETLPPDLRQKISEEVIRKSSLPLVVEDELLLDPVFDGPIDPASLEFTPPK